MRDEPYSSNELLFVLQSLPLRVDGRRPEEARGLRFQLVGESGVLVFAGSSAITFATTTCRVVAPPPHRPTEGWIRVVYGISPGASERTLLEQSDAVSFSEEAVFLERILRESRCIDPESLCIVAGKYAFQVTVQVCVESLDGSGLFYASLAALGSLQRFRRPDFTIERHGYGDERVRLFSPRERPPVPLQLQVYPVILEYALFFDEHRGSQETCCVLDPTQAEENACHARLRVVYDVKNERLLALRQLAGGMYTAVTTLSKLHHWALRACDDARVAWQMLSTRLRLNAQQQRPIEPPSWSVSDETPYGPGVKSARSSVDADLASGPTAAQGQLGIPGRPKQPPYGERGHPGLCKGQERTEVDGEFAAEHLSSGKHTQQPLSPEVASPRHRSAVLTPRVSPDIAPATITEQGSSSLMDLARTDPELSRFTSPLPWTDKRESDTEACNVPVDRDGILVESSAQVRASSASDMEYSISSAASEDNSTDEDRMQDLTQAARVPVLPPPPPPSSRRPNHPKSSR